MPAHVLTTTGAASQSRSLCVYGLSLDPKTKQLHKAGHRHRLTTIECRLLSTFMRHANQILSRKFLMKEVWETDYYGDCRTLEVYVHRLRRMIEPDPTRPRVLQTVRGRGYRFSLPE